MVDHNMLCFNKKRYKAFSTREQLNLGMKKSFEIIRLFSIWPLCSFTVNKYRIVNIFLFTVYVTNQKENGSCRALCKKDFPGPKKRSIRLQSTSLSGQNWNSGGTSLALAPKSIVQYNGRNLSRPAAKDIKRSLIV